MSKKDRVSTFFSGFLAGGLIGATAALLLAPQSGADTRTQMREKGFELKEKAGATYADLEKTLETTATDLRGQIGELAAKIDEAIAQGQKTLSQQVVNLGEEISPDKESTSEA